MMEDDEDRCWQIRRESCHHGLLCLDASGGCPHHNNICSRIRHNDEGSIKLMGTSAPLHPYLMILILRHPLPLSRWDNPSPSHSETVFQWSSRRLYGGLRWKLEASRSTLHLPSNTWHRHGVLIVHPPDRLHSEQGV